MSQQRDQDKEKEKPSPEACPPDFRAPKVDVVQRALQDLSTEMYAVLKGPVEHAAKLHKVLEGQERLHTELQELKKQMAEDMEQLREDVIQQLQHLDISMSNATRWR